MKIKNIINVIIYDDIIKEVCIFPQIYTTSLPPQFYAPDANLEHWNLDSYLCSSGTSG